MKIDTSSGRHGESRDHPSAGEMAAYLDGVSSPEQAARIEAHLAACAECRNDFVAGRDATGSKSPRFRWVAAAIATAAAIALVTLTPAVLDDPSDPVLRGPGATGASDEGSAVRVVAPPDSVAGDLSDVRFVWRSAGSDARYRLTLTTAAGDPVATVTTSDTVVTSIDDDAIEPGTTYHWWVEAFLADRTTIQSDVQTMVRVE